MKTELKLFLLFFAVLISCTTITAKKTVTWKLAELPVVQKGNIEIVGNPKIVKTKLSDAVLFDGDDGYFSNINPLNGMDSFTLEVVVKPDGDGYKSPRFMHFGSVGEKRMMCELRINNGKEWYFDAHLNAGEKGSLTLKDSSLTHPTDKWYTISVVCANGHMATYVNGQKELSGNVEFDPFDSGKASFGFRQNYSSWFKGSIYMIRVSPKALRPQNFLKTHNKLN